MSGSPKIVGLILLCLLPSCHMPGVQSKLEQNVAIHSMIAIKEAQDKYRVAHGRYGGLKELAAAGLIKADLNRDVYKGYRYEIRAKGESYEALAIPLDTQSASYFLDESGRIRYSLNEGKEANKNDQPIAGS